MINTLNAKPNLAKHTKQSININLFREVAQAQIPMMELGPLGHQFFRGYVSVLLDITEALASVIQNNSFCSLSEGLALYTVLTVPPKQGVLAKQGLYKERLAKLSTEQGVFHWPLLTQCYLSSVTPLPH